MLAFVAIMGLCGPDNQQHRGHGTLNLHLLTYYKYTAVYVPWTSDMFQSPQDNLKSGRSSSHRKRCKLFVLESDLVYNLWNPYKLLLINWDKVPITRKLDAWPKDKDVGVRLLAKTSYSCECLDPVLLSALLGVKSSNQPCHKSKDILSTHHSLLKIDPTLSSLKV